LRVIIADGRQTPQLIFRQTDSFKIVGRNHPPFGSSVDFE
jgi:hypothetical protein